MHLKCNIIILAFFMFTEISSLGVSWSQVNELHDIFKNHSSNMINLLENFISENIKYGVIFELDLSKNLGQQAEDILKCLSYNSVIRVEDETVPRLSNEIVDKYIEIFKGCETNKKGYFKKTVLNFIKNLNKNILVDELNVSFNSSKKYVFYRQIKLMLGPKMSDAREPRSINILDVMIALFHTFSIIQNDSVFAMNLY
ncbi:uncharacterized protein LOC126907666 [Daktulosphaira vitifoliae]|uniref:uncharacterized protein LOC126907666 n=1 Tax=Daktulosphaira vitifoliae TaxID=58002 RepID=UPI0021AA4E5C|nr:uncharacterized protein LOC126907666 [Daktulosphaira vitifoliae]